MKSIITQTGTIQNVDPLSGHKASVAPGFMALVNATSDVVYRMSPDWKTMYILEGKGFLTDTLTPITDWLHRYIHPDDYDLVVTAIHKAFHEKDMFQLEHKVITSDGTPGWTLSSAVPICDDNGNIIEWLGAAIDITSRRKTDRALRKALHTVEQQKRLYETITSNTPDLIYVFDLNYRFTYANEALLKMWGKTWENAIGKGLLENGYEKWHAEMHEREIDQVISTKRPIRGEVSFPHAQLGTRIYDYIFSPVINAQGEVEAIAGTTRDISDIKKEEERKNSFISMVSHELKTPLTSAYSFVQFIKQKVSERGDSLQGDMLGKVEKQLAKMGRLINSFLNLSRLESGKMQMDFEPFDLLQLFNDAEGEALLYYPNNQIFFQSAIKVVVNADREKVGQVIQNLISNSVKYSSSNSPIIVSCTIDNQYAKITVSDEGIGINQEDLPKLFDQYYRANNHENALIAGFGIGLYLCAEIINRHAGEIWAESIMGKGSKFHFTLPLFASK